MKKVEESGANNVLEAERDEGKKIVGDTCITTSSEAEKDGRWDIDDEVEVNRRGAHTKKKQQQLEAIKLLFDSQDEFTAISQHGKGLCGPRCLGRGSNLSLVCQTYIQMSRNMEFTYCVKVRNNQLHLGHNLTMDTFHTLCGNEQLDNFRSCIIQMDKSYCLLSKFNVYQT